MARAESNGIALGRSGSAADEAAVWFVRLRDTGLSEAERNAFAAWLARCPTHAAAMAEMADIWAGLDALPDLRHTQPQPLLPAQAGFHLTRRHLLAGLGLSAVAAAGWGIWRPQGIAAPLGAPLHAEFAANAALDLDSLSSLDLDPSEPHPSAVLRHGQVFVTATRPPGQFISLQVPFGHVRAEEAVFNLKLERRRALLSVQSGRVAVDRRRGGVLEIGPLTELAFGPETVDAPRQVAPYRIAPWLEGRLIFDRTLLVDAIDDLNRYRPGRILIGDPRLGDLLVTGTFASDRSDAALDAILAAFSLKSLNFGDALTVLFAA